MSTAHLIRVNGKQAVAGLSWRPLSSDLGREQRAETKSAAQLLQTKFGLRFESPSGEVGIGFLPPTAPKNAIGAYSAAAWLATAIDGALLYLERLPSGAFWILVVRDHFIDPRTDVILVEDEAIALIDSILVEHMGAEAKLRVVVTGGTRPSSTMLERQDTEELGLEALLKGTPAKSSFRITQLIGITPTTIIVLLTLVVLLAAGYGATLYVKNLREKQAFEEMQRQAMQNELIQKELENLAELRMIEAAHAQLQTDTSTPPPSAVLRRCLNQVAALGLKLGGWSVSNIACTPGAGATATLDRRGIIAGDLGTNATLLAAAAAKGWTAGVMLETPGATLAIPDATPPGPRAPIRREQLPLADGFHRHFASWFQMATLADPSISYSFTGITDRGIIYVDPAMDGSDDPARFKPVPPEHSYRKGGFTLTGNSLWSIEAILLDQAYITIESVTLNVAPGSYNWTLTGIFYVSPN